MGEWKNPNKIKLSSGKEFVPPDTHLGYSESYLKANIPDSFDNFLLWMQNNKVGVAGDGEFIYYSQDVDRYLTTYGDWVFRHEP